MEKMGERGIIVVLRLMMIITLAFSPALAYKSKGMTSRDPIFIEGNSNFTLVNGVVSGSGAPDDPFIIEGWDIDASRADGIKVRNTTAFFVIRNCLIRNAKDRLGNGICLENAMNGKIENVRNDNNWNAIFLALSSNNIVKGCSSQNSRRGIFLDHSSMNLIENCSFSNNVGGIVLLSSEFNIIRNCTASSNETGVLLTFSKNNEVTACTVSKSKVGIFLESSFGNVIKGCTVENSSFGGIAIIPVAGYESSDNNRIYHNNFLNNPNQAYENGSNYWDNGYPSGGNYWSDYAGVDMDNDGIGDTPYSIPGSNNQDHYPLMRPFVLEEVPKEVLTKWPVIAEVIGIIVMICIGLLIYVKRR
jgi:parallel beta-helix repeat protein